MGKKNRRRINMADNTKKKKEEQVEEGLPIWMATFGDMMTLLFAFFVLLFSMSTIDPVKVSAMEDAMNENAVQNAAGAAATAAKDGTSPPTPDTGHKGDQASSSS